MRLRWFLAIVNCLNHLFLGDTRKFEDAGHRSGSSKYICFYLTKTAELHRKNVHPVTWALLLFLFLSASVKEEEGIAAPMTEYLGGG